MRPADSELIEALKNGKTSVFKYLYNDFNKVTRFIFQNGGNQDDAEDLFQEALIVLYEKITENQFQLKSKISTYLYAVCRNLWLYHVRDRKNIPVEDIENYSEVNVYGKNEIEIKENETEASDKIQIILEKLNTLKEPCMSILKLFYYQKLSFRQIAEKLNYKTEKVVKNQKYRCIQKLKDELQ